MKVLTHLIRKAGNLDDLLYYTVQEDAIWVEIEEKVTLSRSEFNYLSCNLLEEYSFITENKDITVFLVTNGEEGIVIDTQGYDYPRYSGILLAY